MRFDGVRRVVWLVAVVSLWWASADAQEHRTKVFRRVSGPTREVHLDLATGVYTRGPKVRNRGAGTIADFQNLDAFDGSGFGWLSVDTGGGACRWFCSAAKGKAAHQSQNQSDLMSDIIFYYCSSALDARSGGAGGSVTLGFYEGYTVFGGAPTTAAAIVALTEMPATTSWCCFGSCAGCYGIRVTFPTLVPFADNQFIGYSWQFDDVGSDGIIGATYPFISCVVSCSGLDITTKGTGGGVGGNSLALGEDGQGMLDVIDQFCTAPLVSASFNFGTVTPPFAPTTRASVNMQIQEAVDLAATHVDYNATVTPNSDLLSATDPILGSVWTATLSRIPVTPAGVLTLSLRRNRVPFPNGIPGGAPPFGRVLIAGTLLATVVAAHDGSTSVLAQPVPLELAFCGLHFAAQARSTGGGLANVRLSSAVEGTIGTF